MRTSRARIRTRAWRLFVYDVASTTIDQVSDDAGDDPAAHVDFVAINQDGSQIAYTKRLPNRVLFLSDNGVATPLDSGDAASPGISRDGDLIAFISNSDHSGQNPDGNGEVFVFAAAARGGGFTQITDTVGDDVASVSLSGDGSRVGFVTHADLLGENSDGNSEAYQYDLIRDKLIQAATTTGPASFAPLSSSDNGFLLAYSLDRGAGFVLGVAHLPDIAVSYPLWPVEANIADLLNGICD